MAQPQVFPSLLSADFSNLASEVKAMTEAGADAVHFDVMDGHYVPQITVGPLVINALRKQSALPFDVHLMITPVDIHLEAFAAAGVQRITFHPGATFHPHRTAQRIKDLGMEVGVAINPGESEQILSYFWDVADLVLIMTVNPGFGGQTFIESGYEKIRTVRSMIDDQGVEVQIAVDGGITTKNASQVRKAGADILIAGTAAFDGGPSCYASNLAKLR